SNEYGIGVWDQVTGKQIDFFYESPGRITVTLVCTMLDFREKRMVWYWSDIGAPVTIDEKRVRDAIAMEEFGTGFTCSIWNAFLISNCALESSLSAIVIFATNMGICNARLVIYYKSRVPPSSSGLLESIPSWLCTFPALS
ncbi:BTB/POZ domain-containing protein, partial [Thalictrum thalictroides]